MNTISLPALEFLVHGVPAPQGSKRHMGNGVMVEMSRKVKPWRADVRQAAEDVLEGNDYWDPTVRLVAVDLEFTLARPRSHFRTGAHAHELRPDAPRWVTTRPDLDKLQRSTLDALTSAGVFPDDCVVAQLSARKLYPIATGEHPGCRIRVYALPTHNQPRSEA